MLFMVPLCHTTNHTLEVTIILNHQTNFTYHNYSKPTNTLYISPLYHTTEHTVRDTIMHYHETNVQVTIML